MSNEFTKQFFNWLDDNDLKPKNIADDLSNSTQTISSWRSKGIPKGKEFACRAVMERQLHQKIEDVRHRLIHELNRDQFTRWNKAALREGKTIEDWAFEGLERIAREHLEKTVSNSLLHTLDEDREQIKKEAGPNAENKVS